MTWRPEKRLDPRLRRLVHTSDDKRRLSRDLRRALAVASYNHVVMAPNASSGRGQTRDGRARPEVAAPGTNIVSSHALGGRPNGNGTVHPMRVGMSGTSMSAPHVAGIAAMMPQKNPVQVWTSPPSAPIPRSNSARSALGAMVTSPTTG